ncbi:MAG: TonB-dependent receptor [Xanthomonadales bacterium]|nr:TonB-dependent receptor [Xanthomonadales bacterium]NIX13809.1 TonB-dependent receptor [Xanthomonadales bacterium]
MAYRSLLSTEPLRAAVVCLALSGAVFAQETAPEAGDRILEEVVVTGTYIPVLTEEMLPVTVMDEQAIENTGAVNMPDLLTHIPSIGGFEFTDSNYGVGGARGDVAAVNMRSLGSNNTLVLLNGRRMVTHPSVTWMSSVPVASYNVNSISSGVLRRIEVLRDGAAPLYGADAMAGVVNFISHDTFEGLRISGKHGWNTDTNYAESEGQVSTGWFTGDGRSHFGLAASWYDRNHLPLSELDELNYELDRRQLEGIPEVWRGDTQLRNTSLFTPWALFETGQLLDDGRWARSGTWHVNPDTGEIRKGNTSNRYNLHLPTWVVPDISRYNLVLTFNHEFADGKEFFGDAFYYQADSVNQRSTLPIEEGLAFLVVPPDAWHNPFPGRQVLISRWRPIDLGPRVTYVDNDSWRVMGGLRGETGDWDWESALLVSGASSSDHETNRISKTQFMDSLRVNGPEAINPFAGPGGNSQEAFDAIRTTFTDRHESELALWDFRLNRDDLFSSFGNDAGIALGAEWRREAYLDDWDPRLDGTITFDNGALFDESDLLGRSARSDARGSRDTWSAYSELYLPLIGEANGKRFAKSLELQLAVRYENPSDFSSKIKPKVGFHWGIADALSIRGSYTEGFRAPNLVQLNQGTIVVRDWGIEDPMRADVTGHAVDTGDTYRYTTREANPDLQPEDAETRMAGFVFAPRDGALAGLRLGADFWNIRAESAIGVTSNREELEQDELLRSEGSHNPNVVRADITPADQALFDAWNAANPDDQRIPVGEATNIITRYVNLESREIQGWDAMLEYATPRTRAGSFRIRGDMTRLTKHEQQGISFTDRVRRNGKPKTRYSVSFNWKFREFNASLSMRYIDDFYLTSLWQPGEVSPGTYDPDRDRTYWDVGSWKVYNLALGYNFSSPGDSKARIRLTAGVRNLADEAPPFADQPFGYYRWVHNPYGRVVWLKLDYAIRGEWE